jgi:hypothetical protein
LLFAAVDESRSDAVDGSSARHLSAMEVGLIRLPRFGGVTAAGRRAFGDGELRGAALALVVDRSRKHGLARYALAIVVETG